MPKINYDHLEAAVIDILTAHQAAILKYGVSEIANHRKKSDTTIYAELNPTNVMTFIDTIRRYDENHRKPGYLPKLGVIDFMIDMIITGNYESLIKICSFFNLACFRVPQNLPEKSEILDLLQKFNHKYVVGLNASLDAIKDGKITTDEAEINIREMDQVIAAAAALKAHYKKVVEK